jgi:squalene cyclase
MDINNRFSKILSKYFKDNIELISIAYESVIIVTKKKLKFIDSMIISPKHTPMIYTSDESINRK